MPAARIITPLKAVYTEKETVDHLFPDERSRQVYREEKVRMDQNLIDTICSGKVNPIRGWRIIKGIDQKTLAEMAGVSQPNLSRMEKAGAPIPAVDALKEIASALDVSIKDLIISR
jgi:DNA-binding Xre family transcriptional regulator